MKPRERGILRKLAANIWWRTPEEALRQPRRIAAQVMNIGDYDDVQRLANAVGDDYLRDVLAHAKPGQLNDRSWNYWHHRLGLLKRGEVPPLPKRKFG